MDTLESVISVLRPTVTAVGGGYTGEVTSTDFWIPDGSADRFIQELNRALGSDCTARWAGRANPTHIAVECQGQPTIIELQPMAGKRMRLSW